MSKFALRALASITLLFAVSYCPAQTPAQSRPDEPAARKDLPCSETPAGKGLRFVCPVPALIPDDDEDSSTEAEAVRIVLTLPEGTALRIAIDQRTRISHLGEPVKGHVVQTVYAFDYPVIPAGSVVTGQVTQIAPVSVLKRAEEYANGDFSPFHPYQVTFDHLILPDGRELDIQTTVSRGRRKSCTWSANRRKRTRPAIAIRLRMHSRRQLRTEFAVQERCSESRSTC